MSSSSAKIPSINVPLTDAKGRISPVWHEFLRSFVANSVETTDNDPPVTKDSIVAGAGLVLSTDEDAPNDVILNVGAGSGLTVNANDVNIDISNQANAQASLADEILISDVSDNNAIRKTKISDITNLAGATPGGDDTNVQYNNGGFFDGNSGFTFNGISSVGIGSVLTINGATLSTATSATKFVFNVPAGTSTTHYTFRQATGSGSSDMPVVFSSSLASTDLIIDNNIDSGASTLTESRLKFNQKGVTKWTMGLEGSSGGSKFIFAVTALNTGIVYNIDPTNSFFNMVTSLTRSTTAGITASTTQSQGQGALTTDINEIATCVNTSDTVTLPSAIAGRSCLVINNGAETLQVFPASGDNLGAGVNTATTITTGSRKWFVAFDATNWEPVI